MMMYLVGLFGLTQLQPLAMSLRAELQASDLEREVARLTERLRGAEATFAARRAEVQRQEDSLLVLKRDLVDKEAKLHEPVALNAWRERQDKLFGDLRHATLAQRVIADEARLSEAAQLASRKERAARVEALRQRNHALTVRASGVEAETKVAAGCLDDAVEFSEFQTALSKQRMKELATFHKEARAGSVVEDEEANALVRESMARETQELIATANELREEKEAQANALGAQLETLNVDAEALAGELDAIADDESMEAIAVQRSQLKAEAAAMTTLNDSLIDERRKLRAQDEHADIRIELGAREVNEEKDVDARMTALVRSQEVIQTRHVDTARGTQSYRGQRAKAREEDDRRDQRVKNAQAMLAVEEEDLAKEKERYQRDADKLHMRAEELSLALHKAMVERDAVGVRAARVREETLELERRAALERQVTSRYAQKLVTELA